MRQTTAEAAVWREIAIVTKHCSKFQPAMSAALPRGS